MGKGLTLGYIARIEIRLDWSLLIIFALISLMLAMGLFPAWHPDWGPALRWGTALAAAVIFLVSVLLHELSHALVGRAQGMTINRITLFIFGGMAHLEDEPRTWKAEFWMAIVGPLTSLVLGIGFIWLAGLLGAGEIDPTAPQAGLAELSPAATLLLWVGPVNILLAIFNMVPGFPLDGGRVLRALLWGATGNRRRATRWASRLGQLFAWMLIGAGLAMVLGIRVPFFGVGLGGLWLALIGWFLNNAALMSYRQLIVRETLEDVPVRTLMQTGLRAVAPEMNIERFVREHLLHTDQRAFPVLDSRDRLQGLVCQEDIRRIPQADWPQTPVQAVMTPAQKLTSITPGFDAAEALELLSRRAVNQLPVTEGDRLVGMVRREDLLRWLALRSGHEQDADLLRG
jgi:Zn-dependent protease/CBS domain-containing protein